MTRITHVWFIKSTKYAADGVNAFCTRLACKHVHMYTYVYRLAHLHVLAISKVLYRSVVQSTLHDFVITRTTETLNCSFD